MDGSKKPFGNGEMPKIVSAGAPLDCLSLSPVVIAGRDNAIHAQGSIVGARKRGIMPQPVAMNHLLPDVCERNSTEEYLCSL